MRTGTLHVLFGFFCALFVASQANIIAQAGPVATDVFQLQLTASPEAFRAMLDGWSAEELTRYRSHFAWDSVHPLIYGTLLGLWTLVVHRQRAFSQGALRLCLTLAVAPSVLDYVENAFHLYLEVNRDSINGGTVMVAASAATLKWLCAALACVLLVVMSLRALSGRRAEVATAGGASAKPGTVKSGAAKPDTGKAGTGRAAGGRTGGEVVPAQRAGARDRVTAQVAGRTQGPADKAAPESTGKAATEPAGKSTGKSDTTPTGKADPKSAAASDVGTDAGTDTGTGRDAGGKATPRKRSGSRRGAGS